MRGFRGEHCRQKQQPRRCVNYPLGKPKETVFDKSMTIADTASTTRSGRAVWVRYVSDEMQLQCKELCDNLTAERPSRRLTNSLPPFVVASIHGFQTAQQLSLRVVVRP